MGCPYLTTNERSTCIASPVTFFPSIFELNEFCNSAHQEQCPFFRNTVSNAQFDLPGHRLWSFGSPH